MPDLNIGTQEESALPGDKLDVIKCNVSTIWRTNDNKCVATVRTISDGTVVSQAEGDVELDVVTEAINEAAELLNYQPPQGGPVEQMAAKVDQLEAMVQEQGKLIEKLTGGRVVTTDDQESIEEEFEKFETDEPVGVQGESAGPIIIDDIEEPLADIEDGPDDTNEPQTASEVVGRPKRGRKKK